MIKNERQYRITRGQLGKLVDALRQFEQTENAEGVHPVIRMAELDALRSQIDELQEQVKEYEALQEAPVTHPLIEHIEELPRELIRARISKGWSQRELADRLGLKEQQVQRYEATEYAAASLARVKDVAQALQLQVADEALEQEPAALDKMLTTLRKVGIDWNPLLRKIAPGSLTQEAYEGTGDEVVDIPIRTLASRLGRIFGWDSEDLLEGRPLQVDQTMLATTAFKIPKRVDEQRLLVYTAYAHYLARLVVQATQNLHGPPLPDNAAEVRAAIEKQYGSVSFVSTLKYLWSMGIRVLPLYDPGPLHGACWEIDGESVIVLNQTSRLPTLWLFDALHEAWHTKQSNQASHVEASDDWSERWSSPEEQAAGQFAGDVILEGRAEELAKACVEAAKGSVERLKRAVPRVATEAGVSTSALANYVAFRLSLQDINWWGAARNLQEPGDAWAISRDELLMRVDLNSLGEDDRELLMNAMRDPILEVDYAVP